MPNVSRGTRMGGLMAYLVGPGRANEHLNPHLVAGDGMLLGGFGQQELTGADAQAVARYLNAPAVHGEVEVPGGHVWHCSLSLAAAEGELSDERWRAIATDFMAEMGWPVRSASPVAVGAGAAGERAAGVTLEHGAGGNPQASVGTSAAASESSSQPVALRWAAVRHGLSKNGNDHVHLVVNLVSEDGAVAVTYNDFRRAQSAARVLEKKHDLVELATASRGIASRGWKPAELEAAARRTAMAEVEHARRTGAGRIGWAEMDGAARKAAITAAKADAGGALGKGLGQQQPRRVLELTVRGAATAARTEGEFVRRLRDAGVLVRPRYAEGSRDEVVGFSVALRPQFGASMGERPVWFGGGRLARDLTLPRLRGGWQRDAAAAAAAAGEWAAAARGRRSVTPPAQRRERKVLTSTHAVTHSRKVAAMTQRLSQVPAGNRPLWSKVAGMSAGTLSAWAVQAARSPDAGTAQLAPVLAETARVLSRSAQTVTPGPSSFEAGTTSLTSMAMLLTSVARGGRGAVGQAVLVAQMIALVEAVAQMASARHELDLARDLRVQVNGRLTTVHHALERAGGGQRIGTAAAPGRGQSREQGREQGVRPAQARPVSTVGTTASTPAPSAAPPAAPPAAPSAAPPAASTETTSGFDTQAWLAALRAQVHPAQAPSAGAHASAPTGTQQPASPAEPAPGRAGAGSASDGDRQSASASAQTTGRATPDTATSDKEPTAEAAAQRAGSEAEERARRRRMRARRASERDRGGPTR